MNQLSCIQHPLQLLDQVCYKGSTRGLYCPQCVHDFQIPSTVPLKTFLQDWRSSYQKTNSLQLTADITYIQSTQRDIYDQLTAFKSSIVQFLTKQIQSIQAHFSSVKTSFDSVLFIIQHYNHQPSFQNSSEATRFVNELIALVDDKSEHFKVMSPATSQMAQRVKQEKELLMQFQASFLSETEKIRSDMEQYFKDLVAFTTQFNVIDFNSSIEMAEEDDFNMSNIFVKHQRTQSDRMHLDEEEQSKGYQQVSQSQYVSQKPQPTQKPQTTQKPQVSQTQQVTQQNQKKKSYQFQSGILKGVQTQSTPQMTSQMQTSQLQKSMSQKLKITSLDKLFSLKCHDKKISSVAISDTQIFTGSHDKLIKVWERSTGKWVETLESHTMEILGLHYGYGILASSGYDRLVRVWQACPRWQLTIVLKGHQSIVSNVLVVSHKRLVSSSSDDGVMKVWDQVKGKEIKSINSSSKIYSMSSNDEYLLVGCNQVLQVYDSTNMDLIKQFSCHSDIITCIEFMEDGLCVTGSKDGSMLVWDLNSMKIVKEMRDDYNVTSICYIAQLNMIACSLCAKDDSGKVSLWSMDKYRKIKEIFESGSGVMTLCVHDNNLVAGHVNKRIESYDIFVQ